MYKLLNVFVEGWELEYSALSESCHQEIDEKPLSTDASRYYEPLLAHSGNFLLFHPVQIFPDFLSHIRVVPPGDRCKAPYLFSNDLTLFSIVIAVPFLPFPSIIVRFCFICETVAPDSLLILPM